MEFHLSMSCPHENCKNKGKPIDDAWTYWQCPAGHHWAQQDNFDEYPSFPDTSR